MLFLYFISFVLFVVSISVIVFLVVVVALVFVLVGLSCKCPSRVLFLFCYFVWLLFLCYSCWLDLVSAFWFLLCWFSFHKVILVLPGFLITFLADFSCCSSLLFFLFLVYCFGFSFWMMCFLFVFLLLSCVKLFLFFRFLFCLFYCIFFFLASFVCVGSVYSYLVKVLFFPSTAWGDHWKGFTFHTWRSTAIAFWGFFLV